MAATAEKTDPGLWDKVKGKVTKGDKGGNPGQWSARKAQLAVAEYKKAGGGYRGPKTEDNHLRQWGREDWGTKSGKTSKETGERYLPRKSREKLTDDEYARTTKAKRAATAKGRQFSKQPKDVAEKTAQDRETGARRKAAPKRAAAKPAPRRAAAKPAPKRAAPARKPAAPKRAAAKPTAARKAPAPKRAPAKRSAPASRKPAAPKRAAPARKPAASRRAAAKTARPATKRAPARKPRA